MTTMHVDEIKRMAWRAHTNAACRDRLFTALLSDDRTEAVQAAWALTHLPKEDNNHIANHREELTRKVISTPDTSLRRLTLALLERLDWPFVDEPPEFYLRLLNFCFQHMMLADETYGVRSLSMKLAYRLALPYPELLGELRQSLLLLEPTELGAGVRCTRNKLLKDIKK